MYKFSHFSLTLFYLLCIMIMVNVSSFFLYWITLEINMVLFIIMICMDLNNHFKNSVQKLVLFYFCVQSFSSIGLIFSSLSSFISSSSNYIFLLFFLIKMGLWPFHGWVFSMGILLPPVSFSMILSFQKIPTFLIAYFSDLFFIISFMVISMILGSFFMLSSKSISDLLVSSSLYMSVWILLLMSESLNVLLFFFTAYFIFLLGFLYSSKSSSSSKLFSPLYYLSFLFFMGLPPLPMFIVKLLSLKMSTFLTSSFLYLIMIFCFVSIVGYFKFLYLNLMLKINLNLLQYNYFVYFFLLFSLFLFLLFF